MSDVSRRQFLTWGSAAAGVAAATAAGVAIGRNEAPSAPSSPARSVAATTVDFHGRRQAGIETPAPAHLVFAAFDLRTRRAAEVTQMLRAWTVGAGALTAGTPVPGDSGEAAGLGPARLTLTFGFGGSLFARLGLDAQRPVPLVAIPAFKGDRLVPARSDGDLCVQACSDDPQVAQHAVRNLARLAGEHARLRWLQEGFSSAGAGTPRNLMGFKDGTNNLQPGSREMERFVWVQPHDEPAWMRDGTYLVTRRIRMHLEKWDASSVAEQEKTFGRYKDSGAPFGGTQEHDKLVAAHLPPESHVALANQRKNGIGILRRGYSYSDGVDASGELDSGLFFIAFQRDPRTAFLPLQRKLSMEDELNEYIVHTSSALFAVPPGVSAPGGYVGETLFES